MHAKSSQGVETAQLKDAMADNAIGEDTGIYTVCAEGGHGMSEGADLASSVCAGPGPPSKLRNLTVSEPVLQLGQLLLQSPSQKQHPHIAPQPVRAPAGVLKQARDLDIVNRQQAGAGNAGQCLRQHIPLVVRNNICRVCCLSRALGERLNSYCCSVCKTYASLF